MTARVEELIVTALCDRFRSPTQVWQSMSLVELEEATGFAKESLRLTHLRMVQGGSFSVQSGAASAEISQTILYPTDRESSRCQREKLAEYLK